MQRTLMFVATLALAAFLLPTAFAQQDPSRQSAPEAGQQTSPSSQQQPSPSDQNPGQSSDQGQMSPSSSQNTFTGTVMKSSGKYVLRTDAGAYLLDDQDRAKKYEGQQVNVSGSLDTSSGMIHVTDITAASAR